MVEQEQSSSIIQSFKQLRLAFWQRRFLRGLLRTAWMVLVVPTVVMMGYLWFGWQVAWGAWITVMILVGAISILWALRPISIHHMVRKIENQFDFQTQYLTAYEVSQDNPYAQNNPVLIRLYQDTMAVTSRMKRQIRLLNKSLWLEVEMLIAVSAVFSALLMLDALSPLLPNAAPVEMPPLWVEPSAEAVIPPDPQLFPPPFQPPPQLTMAEAQAIIQALADALRDQGITRSIAEDLDRNRLAEASDGLRALADQLDQISTGAQQELGEALQEAADGIGSGAPTFTGPLQAGSTALDSRLTSRASQALEELAEAVEMLGDQMAQGDGGQGQDETAGGPGQGEEPSESSEQEEAEDGQGAGQTGSEGDAEGGQVESDPAETGTEETAEPEVGEAEEAAEQPTNEEGETNSEVQPKEEEGEPGEEGGGSKQPSQEERLGMEGDPLELEMNDPFELEDQVLQPSDLDAQANGEQTADSPFARPLGQSEELGPDPLSYPWEKRDIIRDYFSGDAE